jgi:hypothetical protein
MAEDPTRNSNEAKARRGELVLCMNLRLARSVTMVAKQRL